MFNSSTKWYGTRFHTLCCWLLTVLFFESLILRTHLFCLQTKWNRCQGVWSYYVFLLEIICYVPNTWNDQYFCCWNNYVNVNVITFLIWVLCRAGSVLIEWDQYHCLPPGRRAGLKVIFQNNQKTLEREKVLTLYWLRNLEQKREKKEGHLLSHVFILIRNLVRGLPLYCRL